jgi:predicted GIY-YIG superfamily endonuclease
MTSIINVDGFEFQYKDNDYINLTKMCKQAGRKFGHYYKSQPTKDYLELLSKRLNIDISKLVIIKRGGIPTEQRTLGHPLVALHLAHWLSPEIYVDIAIKISHLVNNDLLSQFVSNETIKDTSGFIYLVQIQESNLYKIGYSKNVIQRLATLQTANALELIIVERFFSLNARYLEREIHKHYEAQRVRGEWFQLSNDLIKDFIHTINNLDKVNDKYIQEIVKIDGFITEDFLLSTCN